MPVSEHDRRRAQSRQKRSPEGRQRNLELSAAYRLKEKERIARLALAANMPEAMRQADALTLLGRLKLTFTQTWADCVMHIVKQPVDQDADPGANLRENKRLNRARTRAFIQAVEAHLIEAGRLVPEDVLGSPQG